MSDRLNKESLQEATKGHTITLEEWNAVIRAVKSGTGSGSGYTDESGGGNSQKLRYSTPTFSAKNTTGATIPAFSVFGVKTATAFDDNLMLTIAKLSATSISSHLLLVTNGPIAIPNNAYGSVSVIDSTTEFLVQSAAGSIPDPGMPCGVISDTYTVSKDGFGFVCVSYKNSLDQVYVKRAQTLRVVGCVSEIISAYNKGADTFGNGKIKIKYMHSDGIRHDAKNTATGIDWEVKVYNPFDKNFHVGMQITATETLGNGFIVEDASINIICGERGAPVPNPKSNNGCCCDEADCLKIPGYTGTITPAYYQFQVPGLDCGCEPSDSASSIVRLYPTTDPKVWRQGPTISCLGADVNTVPCTNTVTWQWVQEGCSGSCIFVNMLGQLGSYYRDGAYTCGGTPGGVLTGEYAFRAGYPCSKTCNTECGCGELPTVEIGGSGELVYVDCEAFPSGGFWQPIAVSDPDCDCMPPEPDYDGSEDGETAETECESTKPSDEESESLHIAYWQLTIGTVDYFGCDNTKLEFIITDTPVPSE